MNEITRLLTDDLKRAGADLVGIGDLYEVPLEFRKNMRYGVSVAVAIEPKIIIGIEKAPSSEYYDAYNRINEKLDAIVLLGADILHSHGYEAYAQTRAVVSETETNYDSLLPHKTIATRSGIGWIGKCALLVTERYGSAVRISSILTNAPLEPGLPVNDSICGDCLACTKACPAGAVKGMNWNISASREVIFDPFKCRKTARRIAKEVLEKEITLCGKCIYICPYTQRYINS